jgi:hypothetical protein
VSRKRTLQALWESHPVGPLFRAHFEFQDEVEEFQPARRPEVWVSVIRPGSRGHDRGRQRNTGTVPKMYSFVLVTLGCPSTSSGFGFGAERVRREPLRGAPTRGWKVQRTCTILR